MFAGSLLALLWGCGPERPGQPGQPGQDDEPERRARDERPRLGFGIISGEDPGLTYKGYQPLIDHLTNRTPFLFRLSLGRDTDDLLRNVEERMVEVVPLEAVSYLEAHSQFGAVPLVRPLNREGKSVSYCVFVVRKESPIKSLSDLKGRTLALGSFHSTISNLIARSELMRTGVELDEPVAIEHLDDDEAIATAVLEGRFEAGAVGDVVAYRYRDQGLRPFHVSEPVPSAPLVARGDLPPAVFEAIRDALLELDLADAEERESWDETVRYGFAPASDADYDVVRRIVGQVGGACGGSCHSDVAF
jgi:phosphonate transport system substrate-binding protein